MIFCASVPYYHGDGQRILVLETPRDPKATFRYATLESGLLVIAWPENIMDAEA